LSTREQLDAYLAQARQRLQAVLWSRGAAALLLLLFIVTVLAAAILGSSGFSATVVLGARVLLAAIAVTCGVMFWRAARGLSGDSGAAALERALPAQAGRVQTYLQERRKEAQGATPVLLELLAEDANDIAQHTPLKVAIPRRRVLIPGALAVLAMAGLVALLLLTGSLGSGARRLWLGTLPPAAQMAVAAGGIAVKPGDVAVRRNQDLSIAAVVAGSGAAVQVHMQFAGTGTWEVAPMDPDGKGGHAYTLYAVREAARYYVTAGRLRSAEYGIRVVDLPQIESLRLTYNYPGWTGLPKRTEESGGDIRAVAGTRVALEVVTNAPLEGPLLVINGTQSGLESDAGAKANTVRGDLVVKDPGHYRIATKFGDEIVALTQDLAIDVVPDEKPTVQILRPGRDYQATNIEEVPVSLKAQDDFRLEALTLRYSVNGGDFRDEKLDAGATDIQAAALLRLEELQQKTANGSAPLLEPGDLVSYYAVARDHTSSTQTDLFLIQVQPFDRRFTQSQANGGGGGGGGDDDQGAISQRQREVLLATWNLQRTDRAEGRDAERLADNARMLAEVQKTLADQANTLVERARARELTGTDKGVDKFVTSLEEATKAMRPAAEQLAKQDLQAAVKNEQLALQHLLRAEATFREIQVSMSSSRGGGGGGAQAGRDVAEMTELELDLEKNQYETEPQMTAQQKSGAEDDMMRRLKELARRQEQLARQAAQRNTTPEAQRWQQEQLRREAEQLRRELEQLAQQQRSQQGGSQQSGSQQSGSQQSGSQQRDSQSQGAAQAAEQVAQALRDMQQQNASAANRASEQLNRAREQLERGRQQAAGERFDDLARSARELGEKQRTSEEELRAALGGPRPPPSIANPRAQQGPGMGYEQAERLANTKREIQAGLEALQRQMQAARTQGRERAPNASQQVGEAAKELEDSNTTARLARSAQEIERGRGLQAATREGLITESLQQLQQKLAQAASVAATESGGKNNQEKRAEPGDLLAELGELRRALERARQNAQQTAQNQSGLAQGNRNGDPGAQSPDAREGQAGQQGGQTGQQGQSGQGQAGNAGGQQGQPGQAGANGARAGGNGRAGVWGGGVYAGGAPRGDWGDIRPDLRAGSDRLQQLRGELRPGAIPDSEIAALKELAERMRRAGTDPMSAEYQKMVTLVNQIELAALKSEQAGKSGDSTRAPNVVDDSSRYRDNVADYYRRLGQTNE
jgi:hypothetical protein